jgi:hypothetical protein
MTTGPSQISPGQGADDGYVNDLYALWEDQLATAEAKLCVEPSGDAVRVK